MNSAAATVRIFPVALAFWVSSSLMAPAFAYRSLRASVVSLNAPVNVVALSSSLQDNDQRLNATWDTTVTLRRELIPTVAPIVTAEAVLSEPFAPTATVPTESPAPKTSNTISPLLPLVQVVEVELILLGSQNDPIDTVVVPVTITSAWLPGTEREIRLQRAYLGWPASGVRGRVVQVRYQTGEPWAAPFDQPLAIRAVEPEDEPEQTNPLTDPYIPPAVLSAGSGGGSTTSGIPRPVRPRPVRPSRPTQTGIQPNPGATVSPPTPSSSFAPRPSLFNSPTSGNGSTTSPVKPQPQSQSTQPERRDD